MAAICSPRDLQQRRSCSKDGSVRPTCLAASGMHAWDSDRVLWIVADFSMFDMDQILAWSFL